jgi:ADP-ribose pyrophosphatase YjhB (NUDIX family)
MSVLQYSDVRILVAEIRFSLETPDMLGVRRFVARQKRGHAVSVCLRFDMD